MEQCLIDNKVCPIQGKKCKECKLDSCEEILNMIEEEQKHKDNWKLKQIKDSLPNECRKCSILEIIDVKTKTVKCIYRINNKCILK